MNRTNRRPGARRALAASGVAIVALAIGACSAGGQPSGGAGQPTIAPGASTSTAAPAGDQSEDGGATLVLTGDVDGTYDFSGRSGNVSPTSTLIAAVFTDPMINTFTVSGEVANGTRKTSNLLAIGWVIGEDMASFTSKSGECDVTMESNGEAISGTFTCNGVKSADGGKTVNATGSFRI